MPILRDLIDIESCPAITHVNTDLRQIRFCKQVDVPNLRVLRRVYQRLSNRAEQCRELLPWKLPRTISGNHVSHRHRRDLHSVLILDFAGDDFQRADKTLLLLLWISEQPLPKFAFLAACEPLNLLRRVGLALDQSERLQHRIVQVRGNLFALIVPNPGRPFRIESTHQAEPEGNRQQAHSEQRREHGEQRWSERPEIHLRDDHDGEPDNHEPTPADHAGPGPNGGLGRDAKSGAPRAVVEFAPHQSGADDNHHDRHDHRRRGAIERPGCRERSPDTHDHEADRPPPFDRGRRADIDAGANGHPENRVDEDSGTAEGGEQDKGNADFEHVDLEVVGDTARHAADDLAAGSAHKPPTRWWGRRNKGRRHNSMVARAHPGRHQGLPPILGKLSGRESGTSPMRRSAKKPTIAPMTNSTFTDEVREMWRTRPLRTPWNSPLGGVSSGIGIRYGIDPVLVRIAFVTATIFGGAGIVLYLAAWLTFPRAGDEVSAFESLIGRGHSSESSTKTVLLTIAFVIAFTSLGPVGVGMGGSGVISLGLLLVAMWLLHQRRPVPPAPPAPPAFTTQPTAAHMQTPGPHPTTQMPYPPNDDMNAATTRIPRTEAGEPVPPSWDPLGAAPFAWDLPEPKPAPVKVPKPPRSPFTKIVLGLAIIAGAIATAFAYAGGDWFTPARVGAVVLVVLGGGLVIGALMNRGHGLLLWSIPVVFFVTAASGAGDLEFDQPTGSKVWEVSNMSQLQSAYHVQMGEGVIDLSDLELTEDRVVAVSVTAGEATILLPENMNVENHCTRTFAEVQCLPSGINGGEDGAEGPVLTLNIEATAGEVRVERV